MSNIHPLNKSLAISWYIHLIIIDNHNKLFSIQVDMISDDGRRYKCVHLDIPSRSGKLKEINKFDAEFFGVTRRLANALDPMARILLEKTYEVLIDAGMNTLNALLTR